MDKPDVAIELPTGSGKTLVGLLIAEFRRATRNERAVFLCPTKQLVRQVVEQAERKYGIKATAFVGKIKDFDPSDKAKYQSAQTLAVTTYSALFNVNPFFSSPQFVILDDAHASENYIAAAWSVNVDRNDFPDLYKGMLEVIRPAISATLYHRFSLTDPDQTDMAWVEKIPGPQLASLLPSLSAFLDENTADTDLQYPWSFIRDHIDACHVYVSCSNILVRPYIPPSLTHRPFAGANQRVYMSATLGNGGDLERITGVRQFHRLPIPKGWDKQGIGRRFFIFPELSLKTDQVEPLVLSLMKQAKRSLVLVPNEKSAAEYRDLVTKNLKYPVFGGRDIESSKSIFTKESQAVAVLANRYDGIDLIGEECRLLFIKGLPKASNIQERFLVTRLGASTLLDDRIRTRIIQAVGRCTRSATDYAAVVVLGDDFHDWLILEEKRSLFHPEFQAELRFGAEQSVDKSTADFNENFTIFLKHGDDWNAVDNEILELREEAKQQKVKGQDSLFSAASKEVDYQYAMWAQDYEKACQLAQEIASILSGDDTKGFRGFWHYLAGCAARLASEALGRKNFRDTARLQFSKASMCASYVPWMRALASEGVTEEIETSTDADLNLQANVENVELLFESRGYASPRKFEADAKKVLDGIAGIEPNAFEEALRMLGELLGFHAENSSSDAAPDPWWVSNGKWCLVTEVKSDVKPENPVAVKHARQAATHAKWIQEHVELREEATIETVMITPATTIHPEAAVFADEVRYWNLSDFREWAGRAIGVVRKLRSEYPGPGNLAWRATLSDAIRSAKLDPASVLFGTATKHLKSLPKSGPGDGDS